MIITQISQQKRAENKVNVFLDGAFWIGLTKNQLIAEGLYKGKEISIEQKINLEALANENKLFLKIQKFLSLRPRSIKETRDHLIYKKKMEPAEVETLIQKLVKQKYLDDASFTNWFVENRLNFSNYGVNKIKSELILKGISENIIEQVLSQLSRTIEKIQEEKMKKLIERYKKNTKAPNEYQKMLKIKQKLVAKGFSYSEISRLFNQF